MTQILKTDELTVGLVKAVLGCDGDLDTVAELLALDYPERDFTRAEVRELVRRIHEERERDEVAFAPGSIDTLDKKIDRELNKEIDRLAKENRVLAEIAAKGDGQFLIDGETQPIDPQMAKVRITQNTKMLMEIKKSISEHRKSKGDNRTDLSLNVNLGGIISDAVSNIKDNMVDAKVLDIE